MSTEDQENLGKVYKIKYAVNLLPAIGTYYKKEYNPITNTTKKFIDNTEINLLEICCESDEIQMFSTKTMHELIQYKWDKISFNFHLIGCLIHFLYVLALFWYSNHIYLQPIKSEHNLSLYLLAFIAYPLGYEVVQMCQAGVFGYMGDIGNFVDLSFILCSIAMTILHSKDPLSAESKLMMCLVVSFAIRRTLVFLRIFVFFSAIVTMLSSVIWDLRFFMTFYFIEAALFSLMLSVLGIGNINIPGKFR